MISNGRVSKEPVGLVPNRRSPVGRDGWLESWYRKLHLAKLAIAMMVISLGVSAGCGGAGNESPPTPAVAAATTLQISGAGGTTKVLEFLAEAYRQQHEDLVFEFLAGSGSSGGVKGVLGGQFHLGAMSRLPKEKELGAGIEYLNFAEDRVAVVTTADLSIKGLTTQQVKDIFLGEINNWSEVGGPDAPINILVREEKDSNTKILRKGIFGDGEFAPRAVTMPSEAETKDALTKVTNGIGYLAYSGVGIENLSVHALSLDGAEPGDYSAVYPLQFRPLGLSYLPANAAQVKPFLDFLVGPDAQNLLSQKGIGPIEFRASLRNQ